MTLIELMVSISLGVILIGIMVFVWTTSQQVMSRTTDKIAVYQNLRNILDIVEKDVANVVRTTDMEFFNDRNNNAHYDFTNTPGSEEEYPTLRGNDDFFVDPAPADAVQDASLPDGGGQDLNLVSYFYAPTLYRPTNYGPVANFDPAPVDGDPESVISHRRDEFYFRTFALVDGESRPTMIHYRLNVPDGAQQRPTLTRRVTYVDNTVNPPVPVPPRVDELAEGITDLEFYVFYKESRIFDRGQFLDARGMRAINTSVDPNRPFIPGLEAQYNAPAVSLYYSGDAIIERSAENGIWLRPVDENIQFGAVRPGDRFYLYDAVDDDNQPGVGLDTQFGTKFLTVSQIIALQSDSDTLGSNSSKVFIKFVEPIDFSRLTVGLGSEVNQNITDYGRTRKVFQSFQCKFRVGFLPGAFKVRFKYRDFRDRRLIPFERVVRVLNS